VLQRLSIFIAEFQTYSNTYTTGIYRWNADGRARLFSLVGYVPTIQNKQTHFIKLGSLLECDIFNKFVSQDLSLNYISPNHSTSNNVYYRTAGGGYWVTFLNKDFDCDAVSNKSTTISYKYKSEVLSASYNSNLFWWYYSINYDLFNFKDYMIFGFRITYPLEIEQELCKLSNQMENALRKGAIFYTINSRTKGANQTVTYQKHLTKDIMDEIDKVLARHYGFTEEELDFIINYDIKYRMGDELNGEE
jgi:hypothetical protein